jgi:hypothetical protein
MSVSENRIFLPCATSLTRVVRLVFAIICAFSLTHMMAVSSAAPTVIETCFFRFTFAEGGGVLDKQAGVAWRSEPEPARFGEGTLQVAGRLQRRELTQAQVQSVRVNRTFQEAAQLPAAWCSSAHRHRPKTS